MNETMTDRPRAEQINKDEAFDAWLIAFERKMAQQALPKKSHHGQI